MGTGYRLSFVVGYQFFMTSGFYILVFWVLGFFYHFSLFTFAFLLEYVVLCSGTRICYTEMHKEVRESQRENQKCPDRFLYVLLITC